jgi:hypothetical protein
VFFVEIPKTNSYVRMVIFCPLTIHVMYVVHESSAALCIYVNYSFSGARNAGMSSSLALYYNEE